MTYIYQKTEADLYSDLQRKMERAGITNAYPDAVSNILNEFITEELYALSNEFNSKLSEYSFATAEGEALDRLANEMYGMSRFAASKASASGTILFTNRSENDIEIPEGTLISTGQAFSESNIVYEVTESVTAGAAVDTLSSVVALSPGSASNVGANSLVQHNLDTSSLEVTNLYPIVNGTNLESDADFKARALAFLSASASHNTEFMKLNLLEVPGVLNIRYMQGYHGLGTMAVFATAAGNKSTQELRRLVEGRLSELRMRGDSIFFEEGTRLIFDITIGITNTRNYSNEEINQIKSEIRQLIANEFVAAKTRGSINFSNINNAIVSRMRSNFAFTSANTSGSVFKEIRQRSIGPESSGDLGTPVFTFEPSMFLGTVNLKPFEVPEIGEISIDVELIL